MDVTKPYKFIWFGDIHGPKPFMLRNTLGFLLHGFLGRPGIDDCVGPEFFIFDNFVLKSSVLAGYTAPSYRETYRNL